MIREATRDDYRSISEIFRAERISEPGTRKRFLDSLNLIITPDLPSKSERWFVAENRENEVVGAVYCFWGSFHGYLEIASKKGYRWQRNRLIGKTIDFLKNQGVPSHSIHTVVREDEEEKLIYFEKKGFEHHQLYLMDLK